MRIALLLSSLITVLLLGCTPSHTYVLQNNVQNAPLFTTVAIERASDSIEVTPELREQFEAALRKHLVKPPGFTLAQDAPLVIKYRFVHHDTGNLSLRVVSNVANLVGSPIYGPGDGALAIDATFSAGGSTLAQVVADGPIAGTFGTTSDAAETVAKNIARFAIKNFAPSPTTPTTTPTTQPQ